MRFIVDAQLTPKLAAWLVARGHEARHVRDMGLAAEDDRVIVEEAIRTGSVIVTKDADFKHLSVSMAGCKVVWIRFGNATGAELLQCLAPIFPEIEEALSSGQILVEVSR